MNSCVLILGLPGVLNWQLVFIFIFVLISHDTESKRAAVICRGF